MTKAEAQKRIEQIDVEIKSLQMSAPLTRKQEAEAEALARERKTLTDLLSIGAIGERHGGVYAAVVVGDPLGDRGIPIYDTEPDPSKRARIANHGALIGKRAAIAEILAVPITPRTIC